MADLRFGRFATPRHDSLLKGLVCNFKDLLTARAGSSQLVGANDRWSRNIWPSASGDAQFARIEALSISIHITILTLILLPLEPTIVPSATQPKHYTVTVGDISSYLTDMKAAAKKLGGGGGGGERNPLQASDGALVPFNWIQLTPPRVKTPQNPAYAMNPTIEGPPELKLRGPDINTSGNPLSTVLNNSSGPGGRDGIGYGNGDGVGDGNGDGFGRGRDWGTGGDGPISGSPGYSEVVCIYCPTAQFSDEAVKAKFQGTVLLSLIVTTDGRPTDIHISRGLGMGLDDKAIEAVRKWRFKPSVGPDGKAVAVREIIEVVFHLY